MPGGQRPPASPPTNPHTACFCEARARDHRSRAGRKAPRRGSPAIKETQASKSKPCSSPLGTKASGKVALAKICGATLRREHCRATVGTAPPTGPNRKGHNRWTGGWGQTPPGAGPTPEAPRRGRPAGRPSHVGSGAKSLRSPLRPATRPGNERYHYSYEPAPSQQLSNWGGETGKSSAHRETGRPGGPDRTGRDYSSK